MNPSPVARVVLVLSAFGFGAEVLKAQTTPTKEPENVPIDQIPARVAKLDEAKATVVRLYARWEELEAVGAGS